MRCAAVQIMMVADEKKMMLKNEVELNVGS
jgi:hypothetical protein